MKKQRRERERRIPNVILDNSRRPGIWGRRKQSGTPPVCLGKMQKGYISPGALNKRTAKYCYSLALARPNKIRWDQITRQSAEEWERGRERGYVCKFAYVLEIWFVSGLGISIYIHVREEERETASIPEGRRNFSVRISRFSLSLARSRKTTMTTRRARLFFAAVIASDGEKEPEVERSGIECLVFFGLQNICRIFLANWRCGFFEFELFLFFFFSRPSVLTIDRFPIWGQKK